MKRKSKGLINKRRYKNSPPNTSAFRVIEKFLGLRIDKTFKKQDIEYEDIKYEDRNHPYVFAVKRKIIRKVIKDLENIVSWFRKEYKRYLISDQEIFFGRQWIWDNNKIKENLNRKRNTKLIPLMNYLCNHRRGLKESESLADEISAGSFYKKTEKGEDKWYTFVLIIPDYDEIEDKLDMCPSLIQKYLKGMGEAGIIKPIRKAGSHGKKVYALGYYQIYKDDGVNKPKANWFLKSSIEMKHALRDFYRPD